MNTNFFIIFSLTRLRIEPTYSVLAADARSHDL